MQTNFTAEQLTDPRMGRCQQHPEDVRSLRALHGHLLHLCRARRRARSPARAHLPDEGHVRARRRACAEPRGAPPPRSVPRACSCMTACPSGVDYMHLVDAARAHIEEKVPRSFKDRMIRSLLALHHSLSRPLPPCPQGRSNGRAADPASEALRDQGAGRHDRAGPYKAEERTPRFSGPGMAATRSERACAGHLLSGCVQPVLRPDINDATIRLLARRGVDVIVSNGAGCCGAIVNHLGREDEARGSLAATSSPGPRSSARNEIDAIIVNASGCGTTVKDYGRPRCATIPSTPSARAADFGPGRGYLGVPRRLRARRAGALVLAAYRLSLGLLAAARPARSRRTEVPAASGRLLGRRRARTAISAAARPAPTISCSPRLPASSRTGKLKALRSTRADVIAAGNIGCITHLESGLDVPIVHTVELLDWAYGGPVPAGLEALEGFVTDVPRPKRPVEAYIEA